MKSYLGIEIGGTKLQIVAGSDPRQIQRRLRFNVAKEKGGAGIRFQIDQAIKSLLSGISPIAIGVGFGGPVDSNTGNICCSHQIDGWSEFPLGDWLRSLSGAPIAVDNDANVAALGEAIHGAGIGFNSVFYVTLGSGVGGGLVLGGKMYHGAKPGESEIGHVRLDRAGTLVESRCSGWAIDGRIRDAIRHRPDSILARLIGTSKAGEAKYLRSALQQNDADAERILNELAEDLAFALSHVIHLFHPEVVVIGGGLSLIGEPLRAAVERELPRFTMEAFAGTTRIVLAKLGEDAVPVGALQLAISGC